VLGTAKLMDNYPQKVGLEYLVLDKAFRRLFTKAEIAEARRRIG